MDKLTKHDAWLDLFNVRKKDMIELLENASNDKNLGVDHGKFQRILQRFEDANDAVEAQVLIAQKKHLMEQGQF